MNDQEKIDYINTIFPKLSERGQMYLQSIAERMLIIQDSALVPVQSGGEKGKEDETDKN
jgi:hypothetical protein